MAERREADRAAGDGELFRLLVENVVDYAIFVVDAEGLVRSWSHGAERLLGYREDEILGRTVDLFYSPEDIRDGVPQRERREAAETGRGDDDRWHVRRDGTRFWSGGVMTPLRDEAGTLRGFAKIMRDRTEWWHAEQARREGEARLRQVADAMPQIVWVTRPDGYHEYYNRRWYEYIGCTPEECIGHGWNAPLHPDDRQRAIERWDRSLGTGEPYEVEYRFRSREGEYRWFLGRALPVRDDAGRVVLWFGTCTDIEDMKRTETLLREGEARYRDAERELRASRERLVAALSASDTGTFRWDPEAGVFLDFDDGLKGLFGLAPEDTARSTGDFIDRVHPEDRPKLANALDRSLGSSEFEMEFRVVLPGGGVRWLYGRGKMVRDGGGRPAYLVGACTDITKRRRVEEALRDADRRKDVFLATLAHEIRNPLAPIRTGLQILKHEEGDNPAVEPLRAMMERQAAHLATLIDDLMDISRISLGKFGLRKEVVELGPVVDRAIASARPLIEERGHELSVSVRDGAERIEADPTRLEQVLANLLENAAKYTDPGGRVCVYAGREGGEVVISVKDTGIGIDPGQLTQVFDLFEQVERRLDRSQGGLGIGLSLVKSLVEMHGGTVTALSAGPGTGTEFVVRLPALTGDGGDRHEPTQRPLEDGRHEPPGRRILVVDDNQDAADSLARYLRRVAGHRVEVAYDGPGALGLARTFRPDVVLLDIGLPGMSGYEVAQRLREWPETGGARLIALTGWGQEDDRRRSRSAGIDVHLVKPVDPDALMGLLGRWQTAPD